MILFKTKYIVLAVLNTVTLLQVLLYLPNFTCTSSKLLPLQTPQFTFTIVASSNVAKELLGSICEFLRLLSYLAIDLGWNSSLIDQASYNDDNLVNTFNAGTVYNINFNGYCKQNTTEPAYCLSNEHYGMDIISILMRDVGVQLGQLSPLYTNNTKVLGNSFAYTYDITIQSVRRFLSNMDTANNMFSMAISSGSYSTGSLKAFQRGIELAYWLMKFNVGLQLISQIELIISIFSLLLCFMFTIMLILRSAQKTIILTMRLTTSTLFFFASISYGSLIILYTVLKTLQPQSNTTHSYNLGLLNVSIGSGFIFSTIRYVSQATLLVLTLIIPRIIRFSGEQINNDPIEMMEIGKLLDEK